MHNGVTIREPRGQCIHALKLLVENFVANFVETQWDKVSDTGGLELATGQAGDDIGVISLRRANRSQTKGSNR
jgi:hypothetical protein